MDAVHADLCALMIGHALGEFPTQADDDALLTRITSEARSSGKHFLVAASELGIRCTPRIWASFLLFLLKDWEDSKTREQMSLVAQVRPFQTSEGEPLLNELIDRSIAALRQLATARDGPQSVASAETLQTLLDCARLSERCGVPDQAYDIAAAALDAAPDRGEVVESLARFGIENAFRANRLHQVAVCRAKLATAVAEAVLEEPSRRLEAFELTELAIETLTMAPATIRHSVVALLLPTVESHEYLRPLGIQLGAYLPLKDRNPKYQELIGNDVWPPRITLERSDDWEYSVATRPSTAWERGIDSLRMALEPLPSEDSAHVDWTSWTIRHPAYRRAVPQNQSFLREADFDNQLLVLTHELTHVYSYIGALGLALTALRIALFENELTVWSNAVKDSTEVERRMPVEGIANPEPGNAVGLLRAEIRLELIEKATLLQDVWLTWLEGLALFSECAADPQLDPDGISPVTEALRGLVDVFPKSETMEAAFDEIEQLYAEFERRAHAAMESRAPIRFSAHMRLANSAPYFQGYLAVRSVISSWERTVGRPLTGTEAFGLLLHATRYGSGDAIPDLSIGADDFGAQALERHSAWIRSVASLPRQEIEDYLLPPEKSGSGRMFSWENGHLSRSQHSEEARTEREVAARKRLLHEAFDTLVEEGFPASSSQDGDASEWAASTLNGVLRDARAADESVFGQDRALRWFNSLLDAGTLMPIGQASARFHLGVSSSKPTASLAFHLRTTEKLARTGEPSGNFLIIPLTTESAEALQAEYRKRLVPHLLVTRCIDLTAIIGLGGPGACHLLVITYGDWIHVRGATAAAEIALQNTQHGTETLESLIRLRAAPNPLQLAERTLIAPGQLALSRTAEWLGQSEGWNMAGEPIIVDAWVSRLRAKCGNMAQTDRGLRQRELAHRLLAAIWSDPMAAEAVSAGFESLTQSTPNERKTLLRWLYESGRHVPGSASDPQWGTVSARTRAILAEERSYGWTVRPVG